MQNHKSNDGRFMLGFGGILFLPITLSGVWFLLFEAPRPQGLLEWLVRILLEELAFAAFLFFSCGFAWAITGSDILRKLLDISSVKLGRVLIPLAIPLFAVAAWFFVSAVIFP